VVVVLNLTSFFNKILPIKFASYEVKIYFKTLQSISEQVQLDKDDNKMPLKNILMKKYQFF